MAFLTHLTIHAILAIGYHVAGCQTIEAHAMLFKNVSTIGNAVLQKFWTLANVMLLRAQHDARVHWI